MEGANIYTPVLCEKMTLKNLNVVLIFLIKTLTGIYLDSTNNHHINIIAPMLVTGLTWRAFGIFLTVGWYHTKPNSDLMRTLYIVDCK